VAVSPATLKVDPKPPRPVSLIHVGRGFTTASLPTGIAIFMPEVYGREFPVLWQIFPELVIFGLVYEPVAKVE
jgi:hypothetical protein